MTVFTVVVCALARASAVTSGTSPRTRQTAEMRDHPVHPDHAGDHIFRVLTPDQWAFWRTNGYLVIPKVVPTELCDRAAEVLWSFIDADPNDPTTWYRLPANMPEAPSPRARAGMLEIYHDRTMWDIRQHPRVYDTFVDLWGTEALWITLDRANLNVPARDDWPFDGFLHWDIDPQPGSTRAAIQGIVALSNAGPGMGGLQVVPEMFRRYDEIAAEYVDADRPRFPDVSGMEVCQVECNAGDLVIWESRTVHGTSRNSSDRPRLAQYVTMEPANPADTTAIEQRLQSYRDRSAFLGNPAFRGSTRELEVGSAPELTALGRRLLGADPWDV